MPASEQQILDIREDLAGTLQNMQDEEIERQYVRAEEKYSGNQEAIDAYTRLLLIRRLLAEAAKRSDYEQNDTAEKLSQVFDHLKDLRDQFKDDLKAAIQDEADAAGSPVLIGGVRLKPSRWMEYPDA